MMGILCKREKSAATGRVPARASAMTERIVSGPGAFVRETCVHL